MKKLLYATLALVGLALPVQAETVSIALSGTEDIKKNGEYVFAKTFSDHLNANGVKTVIHPSNSVGKEKERFDQTAQGLVHVNFADAALLFKLAPMVKAIYLPFLYNGNRHFDEVVEKSNMISRINDDLGVHGIRLAAFPFRGGQAGIFNTQHPITKFIDLSDIRVRAKDNLQLKIFESWGAKATIVDWSEVANALQTGVADGYVNPPAAATLFGHTDILKHFTPMNIGPSPRTVLLSEDWYASLDDDTRKIIDDGVQRGLAANRAWTENWIAFASDILREKGVKISPLEPGERDKFVEASKPLWPLIVGKENVAILMKAAL